MLTTFSVDVALIFSINIFMVSDIVLSQVIKPPSKPIISFCTGYFSACAVFSDKRMKCWGQKYSWGSTLLYNDILGDMLTEIGDAIPYIDVGTGIGIEKVSCGLSHICVKTDTGDMKCLGDNQYGQVGIGNSSSPIGKATDFIGNTLPIVNLGNGIKIVDANAGGYHSCALTVDGKVKCFGWNNLGQLGLGDKVARGTSALQMGENLPYTDFGVGAEAASVHTGPIAHHSCLILSKPAGNAQRIKCWGRNDSYQLGYGGLFGADFFRGDAAGEMGDSLPLVDLGDESRVKQLVLGGFHVCALLITDNLKCFGRAVEGQIGSGSTLAMGSVGNALPFVEIDSGKTVKFVSNGAYHTCIVYDDLLTMKCFGENDKGQLGQGDKVRRGGIPTSMIPSIPNIDLGTGSLIISSTHCGYGFSCAVYSDGSVKCFGDNSYGQLAIGSSSISGDESYEMGTNLTYAQLFSPTQAPSISPTLNPTKSPIPPTKSPSKLPTSSPTRSCDYQSAKICKYDIKCMWKTIDGVKKCIVFDCTTLNKGKCGKQRKRCKWNKKTSYCDARIK